MESSTEPPVVLRCGICGETMPPRHVCQWVLTETGEWELRRWEPEDADKGSILDP